MEQRVRILAIVQEEALEKNLVQTALGSFEIITQRVLHAKELQKCLHHNHLNLLVVDTQTLWNIGLRDFSLLSLGIPILLLMKQRDDLFLINAIKAGVRGCLLESVIAETFHRAVTHLMHGELWFERRIMYKIIHDYCIHNKPCATDQVTLSRLSRREAQVYLMFQSGLRCKEIADKLYISEKTVRNHMAASHRKLVIPSQMTPNDTPQGMR